MKNKNIIVTGGLGFIGSNLVKLLIKKGYKVFVVDKLTYAGNLKNLDLIKKVKIYKTDINNRKEIDKIIKKHKPSTIFNLAAETHVDRSITGPKNFIKSNILGVFNLLEVLRINNKKIKFIHISTDEVFGDIKSGKYSKEEDRYFPSSPYSSSKAASDLIIHSYYRTYKLPVLITNCCNNFGPNQNKEKLLPKMISSLKKNNYLDLYGNGKNMREWIYVQDHCEALIHLMKKGRLGEQYNIGSGIILNNINIINLLKRIYNEISKKKSISEIKFVNDRLGHDLRYALNSSKIKKLGWRSKTKLNDGLKHTIEWYLKN